MDQPNLFTRERWKPAGFDEAKLNPLEARVLAALKVHVGRARAIKVPLLAMMCGLPKDGRQARLILQHLRLEHRVLIGSSVSTSDDGDGPGIFLIETIEEYEEWKRQEKGRALEILSGIAVHEKTTIKELCGQCALEIEE